MDRSNTHRKGIPISDAADVMELLHNTARAPGAPTEFQALNVDAGKNRTSRTPFKRRGIKDPAGNVFTPYQRQFRTKLISVAMELFHKKGYEATTIAEIMKSVGKTQRTFFRYFRGKDDVAFDWMDEQAEFVRIFLKSRPDTETPMQSMRKAFLELADRNDADERDRVKFLTQLILETPALSARYHHEYSALEIEYTRFLGGRRSLDKADMFALNTQISVVNAAFNRGLRAWVADTNKNRLRSWITIAFAAFKDGQLRPAPSGKPVEVPSKRRASRRRN